MFATLLVAYLVLSGVITVALIAAAVMSGLTNEIGETERESQGLQQEQRKNAYRPQDSPSDRIPEDVDLEVKKFHEYASFGQRSPREEAHP